LRGSEASALAAVIEPRLYRAAFLPALLAAVVVMFSLENRPPAAPQGLPADVIFDGELAARQAADIVRRNPDRRAGSGGDERIANEVARRLAAAGFTTVRDSFNAEGERLVNVVGRRAGRLRNQIVVIAAHDATSVPDATGSAADTAALLELARVFRGRPSRRTLVLASVDGGTLGDAGTSRVVERLENGDPVDAVVVLSNFGARRTDGSPLVQWGSSGTRSSIGLVRTAEASLRQEFARLPREAGAIGQMLRVAAPVGIGAQGQLIEDGLPAVRLSGSGELPPPRSETQLEDLSADRLGDFGRSALRTLSAVDGGPRLEHGPGTYLIVARKVLPGWALAALVAALLLPPFVASVDAYARARRRREHVGAATPWLLAGIVPFLGGFGLAELLALAGAVDLPGGTPAPEAVPLDGRAGAALGVTLAGIALLWLVARPWIAGGRERLSDPGTGHACATALALNLCSPILWLVNPFTALLLVPAAHVWTLALLAEPRPRRLAGGLALATGLLSAVAVGVYYMVSLELNPLDGFWYLFVLVTDGELGLLLTLLGCLLLGVTASTAAILVGGPRAHDDPARERPAIRGPGGHVGPGALGGTPSGIRRR